MNQSSDTYRLITVKPIIRYSQTGESAAIHCSLFAINFRTNIFATGSTNEFLFFDEKLLCGDHYLDANPANGVWRKTCSRNMANTYYTLFAVRPLFHCSRIVYGGLNNHIIIMMVSIPYRYHLIGRPIPFDTYMYRYHIDIFNVTTTWLGAILALPG